MAPERFLNLYSDFLQKFVRPPHLAGQWSRSARPLKAVFDCSDGTAGPVLKKIVQSAESKFPACPADREFPYSKFHILNSEPDGSFPAHGPDPLKKGAMNDLRLAVRRFEADLGAIFDADGDRVFFVDDKGRFVEPDAIARLLIWHLKPKKIVIDVCAGWLIRKFQVSNSLPVRQTGKFQVFQSKVGHLFIKQAMRKENADFGAEHSGHYYFKKFFGLDSGILAAIETFNAVSRLPYKLSDFIDLLPLFYRSPEINIKYQASSIKHQELLKKIEAHYSEANKITKLKAVNYLDGLTVEFSDWWFNMRFSQTEPLLRLNIEAVNELELKKRVAELQSLIKTLI